LNADSEGRVKSLNVVEVTWSAPDASGRRQMLEVPGSQRELPAGLVLLAMGFIHPMHPGLVQELGLKLDPRGNVQVSAEGVTSVPGVFAAGDAVSGASLVVRAMASGKKIAKSIDAFLRAEIKASAPSASSVRVTC
jgi:glutamate synthase (NADPH/NADH) small chain